MKILSKDLISEFYLKNKDKEFMKGLNLIEVKAIIESCWGYVKDCIEDSENFYRVRIKYFGTFLVYPKRIRELYKKLDGKLEKNLITKERYEKQSKKLKEYLDGLQKNKS